MLVCLYLGACNGPQNALDPAGPAAGAIAQIWWVMCIGAALVLALVLGFLGFALFRRGRGPALQQPHRLIVFGGLVFPTAVLAALLVYGVIASRDITAMNVQVSHTVDVIGHRWQWEFHHRDAKGDRIATTFDRLVLPRGRLVEFHVTSSDVIHSFWIPRLGGKIDAIPGRINTLRLRADGDGAIRGQCAEFCGQSHAHMTFAVEVLDGDGFDAWLREQATAARTASTP